jgi:AcrR family transcriptional regulator
MEYGCQHKEGGHVTTRRAQTSHESRELILAAAAELFAGKGYRQTTFVYAAMRSGISRGSIPWHFGSKEGLLLAVLERSMETFRTGLTEEPQGVEAGLRHLTSGVEALFAVPTTKLFEDILLPVEQPLNRDELLMLLDTATGACRAARVALADNGQVTIWDGDVPASELATTYRRRLRLTTKQGAQTRALQQTVGTLNSLDQSPIRLGSITSADRTWTYILFLTPDTTKVIACTGVRRRGSEDD